MAQYVATDDDTHTPTPITQPFLTVAMDTLTGVAGGVRRPELPSPDMLSAAELDVLIGGPARGGRGESALVQQRVSYSGSDQTYDPPSSTMETGISRYGRGHPSPRASSSTNQQVKITETVTVTVDTWMRVDSSRSRGRNTSRELPMSQTSQSDRGDSGNRPLWSETFTGMGVSQRVQHTAHQLSGGKIIQAHQSYMSVDMPAAQAPEQHTQADISNRTDQLSLAEINVLLGSETSQGHPQMAASNVSDPQSGYHSVGMSLVPRYMGDQPDQIRGQFSTSTTEMLTESGGYQHRRRTVFSRQLSRSEFSQRDQGGFGNTTNMFMEAFTESESPQTHVHQQSTQTDNLSLADPFRIGVPDTAQYNRPHPFSGDATDVSSGLEMSQHRRQNYFTPSFRARHKRRPYRATRVKLSQNIPPFTERPVQANIPNQSNVWSADSPKIESQQEQTQYVTNQPACLQGDPSNSMSFSSMASAMNTAASFEMPQMNQASQFSGPNPNDMNAGAQHSVQGVEPAEYQGQLILAPSFMQNQHQPPNPNRIMSTDPSGAYLSYQSPHPSLDPQNQPVNTSDVSSSFCSIDNAPTDVNVGIPYYQPDPLPEPQSLSELPSLYPSLAAAIDTLTLETSGSQYIPEQVIGQQPPPNLSNPFEPLRYEPQSQSQSVPTQQLFDRGLQSVTRTQSTLQMLQDVRRFLEAPVTTANSY